MTTAILSLLRVLVASVNIVLLLAQVDQLVDEPQLTSLWKTAMTNNNVNDKTNVVSSYLNGNNDVDKNNNDNNENVSNDNEYNEKVNNDNDNKNNDNDNINNEDENNDSGINGVIDSVGMDKSTVFNSEVEEKSRLASGSYGEIKRSQRLRRALLSNIDVATALNFHNNLRRQAGASNMQILVSADIDRPNL